MGMLIGSADVTNVLLRGKITFGQGSSGIGNKRKKMWYDIANNPQQGKATE